jgi:hypothetical protein
MNPRAGERIHDFLSPRPERRPEIGRSSASLTAKVLLRVRRPRPRAGSARFEGGPLEGAAAAERGEAGVGLTGPTDPVDRSEVGPPLCLSVGATTWEPGAIDVVRCHRHPPSIGGTRAALGLWRRAALRTGNVRTVRLPTGRAHRHQTTASHNVVVHAGVQAPRSTCSSGGADRSIVSSVHTGAVAVAPVSAVGGPTA